MKDIFLHLSGQSINTWSQLSYMTKHLVPILTRWAFISYIHINYFLILLKKLPIPSPTFSSIFFLPNIDTEVSEDRWQTSQKWWGKNQHHCQLPPLTWDDFLVKYLLFTKLNMTQNLKSTVLKCNWTPYHSVTILYQLWRFCYRNWCR